MPDSSYYPLALGNAWTYKMKDGRTYTSTITDADGATFTVHTTLVNTTARIRKVGNEYQTDGIEAGKWLATFKEGLKKGDTWQIEFKANGIDSALVYTVKEIGIGKEAEGKSYSDVMFIEAESKMSMNGNPIPMKYLTQYYYAKGVGLILTTSSAGDEHALTSYELK